MGIASEQMVPIEALAVEDGVALLTQRMGALGASIPDGTEAELPEHSRTRWQPLAILVATGAYRVATGGLEPNG